MAMNFRCNVRQTAKRFVAAGNGINIGGNLRSATGLAGEARSCHSLNNQPSNKGLTFVENVVGRIRRIPKIRYVTLSMPVLLWYLDRENIRREESARCPRCKGK